MGEQVGLLLLQTPLRINVEEGLPNLLLPMMVLGFDGDLQREVQSPDKLRLTFDLASYDTSPEPDEMFAVPAGAMGGEAQL